MAGGSFPEKKRSFSGFFTGTQRRDPVAPSKGRATHEETAMRQHASNVGHGGSGVCVQKNSVAAGSSVRPARGGRLCRAGSIPSRSLESASRFRTRAPEARQSSPKQAASALPATGSSRFGSTARARGTAREGLRKRILPEDLRLLPVRHRQDMFRFVLEAC